MTLQEKIKDIKEHPDQHRHSSFEDLRACCIVNSAIDTLLVELHEGSHGSNGGQPCDVADGPCSCGAWH